MGYCTGVLVEYNERLYGAGLRCQERWRGSRAQGRDQREQPETTWSGAVPFG